MLDLIDVLAELGAVGMNGDSYLCHKGTRQEEYHEERIKDIPGVVLMQSSHHSSRCQCHGRQGILVASVGNDQGCTAETHEEMHVLRLHNRFTLTGEGARAWCW